MPTAAGIDVSPKHSFVSIADDAGRIEGYAKVSDFEVAQLCDQVDLVVIETPEVGQGWRREAVRNIMPTIHHVGELAGMLKQTLTPEQYLLEVSPETIRSAVAGIDKFSKGAHDPRIKQWLKAVHLPHELKLDYDAIEVLLKAKGALSTADKRDAYLAARFGLLILTDRHKQIQFLGMQL